jgi:multiple sugar transport system substrate-binding protein
MSICTEKRYKMTCVVLCALIVALNCAAKTVTLQWSTWGPEAIDRKLIAAFEETHPDIVIDYIQTPHHQYHQKIKVLTAGGRAPDVYVVDGYYSAEFIASKMIRPIDDLIARTPGIAMSAYFPVALLDVRHRGKTYGLPYCSAPQYYMYNAEHVAEAGLTNPDPHWNRETFLTYARKLTKTDGYRTIRWGTTDRILSRTSVWPWLRGAGGELVDETNRQFRLGEAAAVEALQWVADLHLVYGVGGGDFGKQTRSISADYPGSLPFITGADWPFEWDVTLPPAGPVCQVGTWKANAMAISSSTNNVDEAWALLQFLLGPDSLGHEIYVHNRRFPPQTRDQRLWSNFAKPGSSPASLRDITLLYSEYARPLPKLVQWEVIVEKTVESAFGKIRAGQMSAAAAIEQVRPAVEALLVNEP